MKYFLRRASIGPQVLIEIDEARYRELVDAKKTIVDAGAFEQHYEHLLGNFIAFEMFCANTSLKNAVELNFRYEGFANLLSEANRHAINFLTITRQYADQVVRKFRHLSRDEPFKALAERLLSEVYDSTLEYRFVWELRNYVQHRAFAVHGFKGRSNTSWLEGCEFNCQKKVILEDKGKFKQWILDDLPETIDLLSMFRGYMAEMSGVQNQLRKAVAHDCEQARSLIQTAMDEFAQAQNDKPPPSKPAIGLTVCKKPDGAYTDAVNLLLDWDDVRLILAEKNSRPIRPQQIVVLGGPDNR